MGFVNEPAGRDPDRADGAAVAMSEQRREEMILASLEDGKELADALELAARAEMFINGEMSAREVLEQSRPALPAPTTHVGSAPDDESLLETLREPASQAVEAKSKCDEERERQQAALQPDTEAETQPEPEPPAPLPFRAHTRTDLTVNQEKVWRAIADLSDRGEDITPSAVAKLSGTPKGSFYYNRDGLLSKGYIILDDRIPGEPAYTLAKHPDDDKKPQSSPAAELPAAARAKAPNQSTTFPPTSAPPSWDDDPPSGLLPDDPLVTAAVHWLLENGAIIKETQCAGRFMVDQGTDSVSAEKLVKIANHRRKEAGLGPLERGRVG